MTNYEKELRIFNHALRLICLFGQDSFTAKSLCKFVWNFEFNFFKGE